MPYSTALSGGFTENSERIRGKDRRGGIYRAGCDDTAETVVVLSKLNTKKYINIEIHIDELDLTKAEAKGTYGDIKDYIREKYGVKVSSLNIAQVKEKPGMKALYRL